MKISIFKNLIMEKKIELHFSFNVTLKIQRQREAASCETRSAAKKRRSKKSDVARQAVSRHVTSCYVSSRHFRKYNTAMLVHENGYLVERNSARAA